MGFIDIFLSFLIAFLVSLALVPIVNKITKDLGIIAQTNHRTIHSGIIARTGGYAIYLSFLITIMIFLKTDRQINSILIGGFVVFITGFYDDIHELSAKGKLVGQIIAALIVMIYGDIYLKSFYIPILPEIVSQIIAIVVTIGWIVGITNAVNLIDGLDGLCSGVCIIVLFTISMISLSYGRTDISSLSLLLAGAIAGFLVYNFHPASVFLGDCGALFLGFMISVISLLGFGYQGSAFFTLGAPIIVLMVPIMDTFIAIVRRKVHHQKFSEADRNHLHHKLMFKLELGQTKSVIVLYIATILFSLCSYLNLHNKMASYILFIILIIVFEIFVEATSMIARHYKPLLTILNIFIKSDKLPKIKESKTYMKIIMKLKERYLILIVLVLGFSVGICALVLNNKKEEEPKVNVQDTKIEYVELEDSTDYMKDIYPLMKKAVLKRDKEKIRELVALYFACDYYSLSNKEENEIGGMEYFYKDKQDDFMNFAVNDYYSQVNTLIQNNKQDYDVVDYEILSNTTTHKALYGLEDYNYYDINIKLIFNKTNPILTGSEYETHITLIEKDNVYYVVAIGE